MTIKSTRRGKTEVVHNESTMLTIITEPTPAPIPGTDEVGILLFDGNSFDLTFDTEAQANRAYWAIANAQFPLAYAKAIFNSDEQRRRREAGRAEYEAWEARGYR